MGDAVLERLVEPVAGGVYSTDPDVLEVAAINPRLLPALAEHGSLAAAVRALRAGSTRPGSAVAGLRGGMGGLVAALVAAVVRAGGEIRTDTPVLQLLPDAVLTPAGPVPTSAVVLALPAAGLRTVLGPVAPAPSTTEVALVTLVLDAPDLDAAPRGTGVLVARRAGGVTAKALTHATAKWSWLAELLPPGRHVVRVSYGRDAAGADLPAAGALPDLALRDAADLLGVSLPDPAEVAVTRWAATVPRPGPGFRDAVQALHAQLPAQVAVTGAAVAGTGLAAVVADADAAGRRVTDRLLGRTGP
jgi:protoporphyrinogen/coproporphyrinogen III oxidase